MQLLKGRPNYRSIMEEEEPSQLNLIEDTESLLQFDEEDYKNYKQTINQIETFDHCIKEAPQVQSQFMRAVIQGNVSLLKEVIENYQLSI